jgi:hypothetical protein
MSDLDFCCCPQCGATWEGLTEIARTCRERTRERDEARAALETGRFAADADLIEQLTHARRDLALFAEQIDAARTAAEQAAKERDHARAAGRELLRRYLAWVTSECPWETACEEKANWQARCPEFFPLEEAP